MQQKDLDIRSQLRLGFGTILTLVLLLGVQAWVESDRLWNQAKWFYDTMLASRKIKAQAQRLKQQNHELDEQKILLEALC